MDSEREFDYSWDDQDPDQMTDLVAGAYATSPDIEDHGGCEDEPECSCTDDFTDSCNDCGHTSECCTDSNCSLGSKMGNGDSLCSCDDAVEDECDNCGHALDCNSSDCDSHSDTNSGELLAPQSSTSPPPRLTPSQSLVEAIVKLRLLKSKTREMQEEERAIRDMIVEATGDRESVLIDPKDPNRVLATVIQKPSTWMRAGGQASLKKNHPELFQQLYETRVVTRLLLKNAPSKGE